jgi:hypothetical protein
VFWTIRKGLSGNGRALNSALECHLHTFPRSNTFNHLTKLPGTAKYLTIRGSQNENGGYEDRFQVICSNHTLDSSWLTHDRVYERNLGSNAN